MVPESEKIIYLKIKTTDFEWNRLNVPRLFLRLPESPWPLRFLEPGGWWWWRCTWSLCSGLPSLPSSMDDTPHLWRKSEINHKWDKEQTSGSEFLYTSGLLNRVDKACSPEKRRSSRKSLMNCDSVKRRSYSLSTLNLYTSLMYCFPFRSSWKAWTSPDGRDGVSDGTPGSISPAFFEKWRLVTCTEPPIGITIGTRLPSSWVSEESLSSVGRSSLSLKSSDGEGARPLDLDSLLSGKGRLRRPSGRQPENSSSGGTSY